MGVCWIMSSKEKLESESAPSCSGAGSPDLEGFPITVFSIEPGALRDPR